MAALGGRAACALATGVALLPVAAGAAARGEDVLDTLHFGDRGSERAHAFASENSEARTGGPGEKCRVILPTDPPSVSGGSITFTVACDPEEQNYLTARLWGGDVGETVLYLFHDGRQMGSNQSDWPALDKMNWREKEPRFPGRFFYSTYILPRKITDGKTRVTLQIVSKGRVYSYSPTYEKAQRLQEEPSQGVYAVYVHTDPFFVPPDGEVQGEPVAPGPAYRPPEAPEPYEQVLGETRRSIEGALRRELSRPDEILGVAMAYREEWSAQHRSPAILERIVTTVDTYALRDDVGKLGWSGPGELAEALWRVFDEATEAGHFEKELGDRGRSRRDVYADFFRKALDHQTEPRNRGGLTNQDVYITMSIYRTNMLLKRLAPDRALPEAEALDFVHQAIGLSAYRGRHYPGKGVQQSTAYRFIIGGPVFLSYERDYYWVSRKGSSKEHGFVPAYGELAQQTATLYELTRDEKVKEQAIRMIAARAPFRVPANDRDGNAAVRIEAVIGWRHAWYPGSVQYGDQYFRAAGVLGDPISLRLAQLYLEHGMVYRRPSRPSLPLMVQRVGNLRRVLDAPPSAFRLPMREGEPDFAWADEGIRAVVFKHMGRRCWMTLGWRAAGINYIARVHYTEPTVDRIASIRIATEYTPSGNSVTRPKERNGCFVEPGKELVTDGEELPLAAGSLGGAGDFYTARYGEYLIGMNCTTDRTFELEVPSGPGRRRFSELVSGRRISAASGVKVKPSTTLVLFLGR